MEAWRNFWKAVQDNGGIRRATYQLYRMNDLKDQGRLIGTDELGNKYYENNRYFYPRNRWVEYNPNSGQDYDASMVSPEWYGWLHHRVEHPPTVQKREKCQWSQGWKSNPSGTPDQYMPYSTTQPKVVSWQPKSKRSQQR